MRTSIGTALLVAGSLANAQTVEPAPLPTNATESVKARLVQMELIVDEKAMAGRELKAADLILVVGERTIEGFHVDRMCSDIKSVETTPQSAGPGVAPPIGAARRSPTIVFFFDQTHVTMMGRDLAIETTKALVDRLVVAGARAAIVSSASTLKFIVPLTEDRARLKAGLDAMRKDPREWDSYAATEDSRLDDVVCEDWSRARWYQREDWSLVRRTKDRLIGALDALAEASPPKAILYFGDTLRQKAGLIYFIKAACSTEPPPELTREELVPAAAAEIDAMIDAVVTRGAHFFTIEPQGLLATRPGLASQRIALAEDTLVGLAAETGGEAFIAAGSRAERVASHVGARISCPYILSFPPADLPRDRPLAVTVESHIPGVSVRTQGRLVIPSDSALLTSRLSAAFVDPTPAVNAPLHVALVPRHGDGRSWTAGAQVRLDADAPHKIGVDLGASIIQGDRVVDHFSKSIGTAGKGRPLIVEQSVSFASGPVRTVAVAYDRQGDDIFKTSLDGDWPNPAKSDAVIAPIAVLQTRAAASSKDGKIDAASAIALDANELIDPSRPVALESVVCRGPQVKGALVVERRLEGGAHADYAPMTINPEGEPCIQTVDVLQPAEVHGIAVDYRIVVRAGSEIVADLRKQLRFAAAAEHR